MRLLLIFLLLMCGFAHAQSLLAPQSVLGLKIEIVHVGTTSPLFQPTEFSHARGFGNEGGFGFDWRETRLAPDENYLSRAELVGVVGEDGHVITPTVANIAGQNMDSRPGPDGHAQFFWQSPLVDPRWRWMDAIFEIAARNLTARDRGEIQTPFEFPLPLPEKGEAPLDLQIQGEKGTMFRVVSIRKDAENANLWRLKYRLEKQPRALMHWYFAPDVNTEKEFIGLKTRTNGLYELREDKINTSEGELQIIGEGLPAVLQWRGLVVEKSRLWRAETKFQRLQFRVPVAPVVQLAPVAQKDALTLGDHQIWPQWANRSEGNFVDGRFVFVPKKGETVERITANFREGKAGQDSINIFSSFGEEQNFFWTPNSQISPVGAQTFRFFGRNSDAPKVEISGEVQTRETFEERPVFWNIPVPAPHQILEFGDDERESNAFTLRKVAFLTGTLDFATKNQLRLDNEPALVFVFQRRRLWPQAECVGRAPSLCDDRGVFFNSQNNFSSERDPLPGAKLDGEIFTVCWQLDSLGSQSVNLEMLWREFKGKPQKTPISFELPLKNLDPQTP